MLHEKGGSLGGLQTPTAGKNISSDSVDRHPSSVQPRTISAPVGLQTLISLGFLSCIVMINKISDLIAQLSGAQLSFHFHFIYPEVCKTEKVE